LFGNELKEKGYYSLSKKRRIDLILTPFKMILPVRCIQDESIPLALNVIILRLLSDVKTIKL